MVLDPVEHDFCLGIGEPETVGLGSVEVQHFLLSERMQRLVEERAGGEVGQEDVAVRVPHGVQGRGDGSGVTQRQGLLAASGLDGEDKGWIVETERVQRRGMLLHHAGHFPQHKRPK